MKMKNLFLLAIVAISMSFASCGDSVDCNDEVALEAELEDELNALITAGVAYAADPTNSDACKAYVDAIKDYIDAIKPYEECLSSTEKEEYDASIAELETISDDLGC